MSNSLNEYQIPHAGLKKDIHEFSYELTEKFFANFENALIQKCEIQVNIILDNRQEPLLLEIDIDGIVWSDCDKCTAPIPIVIHSTFEINVKYTNDKTLKHTDETDIMYIARDEQYIDIAQYLYDFVHLSIPVHVICDQPGKTDYCDMEIIGLLEKQQTTSDTDPRWSDLDKLKDKLN